MWSTCGPFSVSQPRRYVPEEVTRVHTHMLANALVRAENAFANFSGIVLS